MKLNVVAIVLLAAVAAGCLSSKQFPFPNPDEGINFSITNAPATLRRLDSIKVPKVSFKDTEPIEAINVLITFSFEYEKTHEELGLRFFIPMSLEVVKGPIPELPHITFIGTNVSLLKAVEIIADQIGMDYILYDEGLLRFVEKKTGQQQSPAGDRRKAPPAE